VKGRVIETSAASAPGEEALGHGLACPSCDDGTLSKRLAASVREQMLQGGQTVRRDLTARYVYTCDTCDHMEEVVRQPSDG
jgi:hypothetical protein